MKKTTLILFFLLASSSLVFAQRADSLRIKILSDSINKLYERYFKIEESTDNVQKKVNNALTSIEGKVKVLENQAQGQAEKLSQITDEDKRTVKTIYEKSRLSIVATANLMDAINTSLNALEFSVSSLDYSNSIFELNNPTNNDLGFSLDKAVLKIMDERIIKGKFGKRFGDRLRTVVSSIINNPIVNPIINNPITKAIVSTVPAVNSLSSVFNVVNSLAVTEPDLPADALKNFNQDLQRYVAHYEALAKASRDLDFNLVNLKLKSESVRKLATNYVRQSVEDLYTRDGVKNLPNLDMNTLVKRFYNYASVTEFIKGVEKESNNNYNFLSKRLVYPIIGRSKVAFINEEVEKLYNEYVTTLSNYHNNVITILNNATKLSDDQNKITAKIYDLDNRYKNLVQAYEKNVDLPNIKALEDNIPRY
ncbi:MAG: hypothetical protein MUE85_09460 [Microscillaceae bacterium]|jgi:hypothetical protein|nr:hypothetical protein [Microscillaceae bacterium]